MGRGGKREGAGRKLTGNQPKNIVRRMTPEDAYRLDNLNKIIKESEEKTSKLKKVSDFETYELEGELVIKLDDLIAANVFTSSTHFILQ
jgi:hypothetical protein